MIRWQRSSNYISSSGAEKLKTELHQLWKVERPQVTQVVSDAAKNGDRSENGDYIYGKRRLREIDNRIRYLTKRLAVVTIVDSTPADTAKVYFGATVTLTNLADDSELQITLLGADEIDTTQNIISIDSPMSKTLLGKQVDDNISLTINNKKFDYRIDAISHH